MASIEEKFNILIEKITGLEMKLDENRRHQEEEIKEIKVQFKDLKTSIETNSERDNNLNRKRNIIIFGINRENFFEINRNILEILEYIITNFRTYDITEIRKLNPKNKNGPILVKLNSLFLKKDIMKNKSKLAKSDKFKTIRIKDDLPKSVREIRKELYPFMKTHWEKGNKATLRFDKLCINDQLFSLEELKAQETLSRKRERSEEKVNEAIIKNSNRKPISQEKKKKETKTHHRSISLDRYLVTREGDKKEDNKKEENRKEENKKEILGTNL